MSRRPSNWLEVMLLAGYTAIPEAVQRLAQWIRRIQPDKVQLNTAVRPPAEHYAMAVPPGRLDEFARMFDPRGEVIAEYRGRRIRAEAQGSVEAVLTLLQRRPCTLDDVARGLNLKHSEAVKCVLYSVDFADIEALQREGRWEEAAQCLVAAAQGLQRAGAEVVVLCTNTMHKLAETIQAGLRVPFLHVADATAQQIERAGVRRVGLLGTRFTMEEEFFRNRLTRHFNLEVMVPLPSDREEVHRIIYEELCVGTIQPESRAGLSRIMARLAEQGAGGIILGCTELGLLVVDKDSPVPLFDTTRIHALAAVAFALNPQQVIATNREGPPRTDATGHH